MGIIIGSIKAHTFLWKVKENSFLEKRGLDIVRQIFEGERLDYFK